MTLKELVKKYEDHIFKIDFKKKYFEADEFFIENNETYRAVLIIHTYYEWVVIAFDVYNVITPFFVRG